MPSGSFKYSTRGFLGASGCGFDAAEDCALEPTDVAAGGELEPCALALISVEVEGVLSLVFAPDETALALVAFALGDSVLGAKPR
jgi:hypothetical protein